MPSWSPTAWRPPPARRAASARRRRIRAAQASPPARPAEGMQRPWCVRAPARRVTSGGRLDGVAAEGPDIRRCITYLLPAAFRGPYAACIQELARQSRTSKHPKSCHHLECRPAQIGWIPLGFS